MNKADRKKLQQAVNESAQEVKLSMVRINNFFINFSDAVEDLKLIRKGEQPKHSKINLAVSNGKAATTEEILEATDEIKKQIAVAMRSFVLALFRFCVNSYFLDPKWERRRKIQEEIDKLEAQKSEVKKRLQAYDTATLAVAEAQSVRQNSAQNSSLPGLGNDSQTKKNIQIQSKLGKDKKGNPPFDRAKMEKQVRVLEKKIDALNSKLTKKTKIVKGSFDYVISSIFGKQVLLKIGKDNDKNGTKPLNESGCQKFFEATVLESELPNFVFSLAEKIVPAKKDVSKDVSNEEEE